jgi:hypothetical protein
MAIPGLGGRMSAEQILGMTTEEFTKKMEAAVTKDDLKAFQSEQSSTLQSLKEALEALKPKPVETPNPQLQADADDPTTSMLADPTGFISRQTMGVQNTALAAKADVQEMRARQENPGAFQKYGKELMESAKSYSVQFRAQDGFWRQHIASFIGNKFMAGEIEQGSYPSLLGSSSVAASGAFGGESIDVNRGFTNDQVAYFKERGISVEKAAAYRDLMDRDKEPIDMGAYKKRIEHAA